MNQADSAFDTVPVIDVGPLYGDTDSAIITADLIRRASTEVGFFYVQGHNVKHNLLRAVQMAAKYFFSLSDKLKQEILINNAHRGYIPFAQTTLEGSKAPDLKESFNFAYPFSKDDPEFIAGRPLVGCNQWPVGEQVWREIVEDYYHEVTTLGHTVLQGVALSLGLGRHYFRTFYQRPLVRSRLLHYPPFQISNTPDQFGAAPHTDYGCITLLWQDDVGGLEVQNRRGQWVPAPYIEGTFLVNIGDMLALWSNDTFVSTPHRVMNVSGRERYSIPTFFDPDFDAVVQCLPNCTTPQFPPRHRPIVAGEYITAKYDASYSYRSKGTIAPHKESR